MSTKSKRKLQEAYIEVGIFTGYLNAHEIVTLEPGGDVYDGVTSLAMLDTAMNVIMEMTSESRSTRITQD